MYSSEQITRDQAKDASLCSNPATNVIKFEPVNKNLNNYAVKVQHYRSASDLHLIDRLNTFKFDGNENINCLKDSNGNANNYQDLKIINHSLRTRLAKEKQSLADEQSK